MASGSESINLGSDEVIPNMCDVCLTRKVTEEAKSFCTVCNEYLCQRCQQSHRGSKATRDHRLLTGCSMPSGSTRTKPTIPIMFCDAHKSLPLDIFCSTHDEVICSMCNMSNHAKCDTTDVRRHVPKTNAAGTINTIAQGLKDLTNKCNTLQQIKQADKSSMKVQIQNCFQTMHQMRKDINEKLDQLEKKMAAVIRQFECKLSKEIDEHGAISKNLQTQIIDLNNSLDECQKTRDSEVMFIGMKKAATRKIEFEKIIESLQEDMYSIDIRLDPSNILTEVIDQLQTIGTLITKKQASLTYHKSPQTSMSTMVELNTQFTHSGTAPESLLNVTATNKQAIDLTTTYCTACVFMPDGHLILGCGSTGLYVYDRDFKFKSQLPVPATDVAVINDTEVVVTLHEDKQLKRIRVLPDMKTNSTLEVDRRCFGIDVFGGEMFVTCHDDPGDGEVRVLDTAGNIRRRLGVDHEKHIFTSPYRVKVSKDGRKLFVSDWYTHIVTCLNQMGHVIYQYSNRDLKKPLGMYVDGDDNLLVCGRGSDNVHVLRHEGRQQRIMLSEKHRIQDPVGITYRQSDGCLALLIRNKKSPKLITFLARS